MHRTALLMLIAIAPAALTFFIPSDLCAEVAPAEGLAAKHPPAAGETVLSVYLSRQHAIVIIKIGDNAPVPVLFDTGTTDEILDTSYAARLGLPRTGDSHVVDGASGKPVPGYSSVLPRLTIGRAVRSNVPVQVTAFSHPDVVGVFGPYMFSGDLVTLELGCGRIRVLDKESGRIPATPSEPYLGPPSDALPAARISIAGVEVSAHLDSGNNAAVTLPLAMAARIPLQAKPQKTATAQSASGEQDVWSARLKGRIRVGPLVLENPSIDFVAGASDANIGLPILRQLIITLDPAERRSWITGLVPKQSPMGLATCGGG